MPWQIWWLLTPFCKLPILTLNYPNKSVWIGINGLTFPRSAISLIQTFHRIFQSSSMSKLVLICLVAFLALVVAANIPKSSEEESKPAPKAAEPGMIYGGDAKIVQSKFIWSIQIAIVLTFYFHPKNGKLQQQLNLPLPSTITTTTPTRLSAVDVVNWIASPWFAFVNWTDEPKDCIKYIFILKRTFYPLNSRLSRFKSITMGRPLTSLTENENVQI